MLLTERQRSVLEFIRKFHEDNSYSPTQREIQEAFGMRSPTACLCHLAALEKKGYIRRTPNTQRSIVVLK